MFGSSECSYKCSEYSTKHTFPLDTYDGMERCHEIDCDIRET